jgi:hypothetical protein
MSADVDAVAQALVDRLEANKVALGLVHVWYGDQQLIPEMPAACVEIPTNSRERSNTGHIVMNNFETNIFVYHSQLQEINTTRKEVAQLGMAVANVLDADGRYNDLLIDSYISTIEPGYAERSNVFLQAVRLTWTGRAQSRLGGA